MSVLALSAFAFPGAVRADESLELAVKAAYLYKMAPFVDWPATAFESASSPFVLCVVGKDPFGAVLDRAVAGQIVDGRRIVVRRLQTIDKNSGCHAAYLGGSSAQSLKQALRDLKGAPVLTVTDGGSPPAMVDLTLSQGRVRFRIDDVTASQCGLKISSKLLSLALSVASRRGSNP